MRRMNLILLTLVVSSLLFVGIKIIVLPQKEEVVGDGQIIKPAIGEMISDMSCAGPYCTVRMYLFEDGKLYRCRILLKSELYDCTKEVGVREAQEILGRWELANS